MEKRTPNKRKSLANSNGTPNKIRKADTPVSHNVINKSPNKNGNKSKSPNKNQNIRPKKQVNGNHAKENKNDQSVNKIKQNQTNGNKSKSPNKNQNITPKKQVNGNHAKENKNEQSVNKIKQNQTNGNKSKSPSKSQNITPNKQVNGKQNTPEKQINAKQTTPKKQVNTKQTKRNNKSKQEEEDEVELMDNSDEYGTDNSIEEMNDSDVEEEAVSDEDVQVDEDESGDEAQVDEDESGDEVQADEDESGDEVQVDEDEEADSEEDENDDDEVENDEVDDLDEEADNEEINKEDNDAAETKFSVFITDFKPSITMDRIFPDCNINTCKKWKYQNLDYGVVYFADMESLKKALAKREVNVDGNIIKVNIDRKTQEFSVHVPNLHQGTDIRDVFNDCNIFWADDTFVYFEDIESMQKALLKSGSEVNGNLITVIPTKSIVKRLKHLSLCIHGFDSVKNVKIEDILEGCNIKFYYFRTHFQTNKLLGTIEVTLEDEESLQKALLKHDTEYNGSVIKVFRKFCQVFVRGVKENAEVEKLFPRSEILSFQLLMYKGTNEVKGAIVQFKDYSSLQKALSMRTPPGITIHSSDLKQRHDKFGKKSEFTKNRFNKRPYQQTRGNEAKKLLLQELKSQVQKLTEEVYGPYKPRPRPFMSARRNPRIN